MTEHDPRIADLYKLLPGAAQHLDDDGNLIMHRVTPTQLWRFCALLVQMINDSKGC